MLPDTLLPFTGLRFPLASFEYFSSPCRPVTYTFGRKTARGKEALCMVMHTQFGPCEAIFAGVVELGVGWEAADREERGWGGWRGGGGHSRFNFNFKLGRGGNIPIWPDSNQDISTDGPLSSPPPPSFTAQSAKTEPLFVFVKSSIMSVYFLFGGALQLLKQKMCSSEGSLKRYNTGHFIIFIIKCH